jgi:hypothetical protein
MQNEEDNLLLKCVVFIVPAVTERVTSRCGCYDQATGSPQTPTGVRDLGRYFINRLPKRQYLDCKQFKKPETI